jgi:hypothetical protein
MNRAIMHYTKQFATNSVLCGHGQKNCHQFASHRSCVDLALAGKVKLVLKGNKHGIRVI